MEPEIMERGAGHKAVLGQFPSMIVKQTKKGWLQELILGCSASQEYILSGVDTPEQMALYALEDSSCFDKCCCGNMRYFELHLSQQQGSDRLLTYKRPLRCCAGSCCCQQEITTWNADSEYLGMTKIPWYCFRPKLESYDRNNNRNFTITKSGSCPFECCIFNFCKTEFTIKDMEGTEVGRVAKLQSGILKELFTDADTFQVDFPPNLGEDMKAVMLGSTFLLDMIFFENDGSAAGEGGALGAFSEFVPGQH